MRHPEPKLYQCEHCGDMTPLNTPYCLCCLIQERDKVVADAAVTARYQKNEAFSFTGLCTWAQSLGFVPYDVFQKDLNKSINKVCEQLRQYITSTYVAQVNSQKLSVSNPGKAGLSAATLRRTKGLQPLIDRLHTAQNGACRYCGVLADHRALDTLIPMPFLHSGHIGPTEHMSFMLLLERCGLNSLICDRCNALKTRAEQSGGRIWNGLLCMGDRCDVTVTPTFEVVRKWRRYSTKVENVINSIDDNSAFNYAAAVLPQLAMRISSTCEHAKDRIALAYDPSIRTITLGCLECVPPKHRLLTQDRETRRSAERLERDRNRRRRQGISPSGSGSSGPSQAPATLTDESESQTGEPGRDHAEPEDQRPSGGSPVGNTEATHEKRRNVPRHGSVRRVGQSGKDATDEASRKAKRQSPLQQQAYTGGDASGSGPTSGSQGHQLTAESGSK